MEMDDWDYDQIKRDLDELKTHLSAIVLTTQKQWGAINSQRETLNALHAAAQGTQTVHREMANAIRQLTDIGSIDRENISRIAQVQLKHDHILNTLMGMRETINAPHEN